MLTQTRAKSNDAEMRLCLQEFLVCVCVFLPQDLHPSREMQGKGLSSDK